MKRILSIFLSLVLTAALLCPAAAAANETDGNDTGWLYITLDPGHGGDGAGGNDPGAISSTYGYHEADLVLKIGLYLKEELETYRNVHVDMTRSDSYGTSATAPLSKVENRVLFAAGQHSDLLVSLHLNSSPSQSARGAEVLVSNGNYRPEIADVLDGIGRDILMQLKNLGIYNRGLVKKSSQDNTLYPNGELADYYGIVRYGVENNVPSMIVEHCFISSNSECEQFLSSDAKLRAIAQADARGIAAYYGLQKKDPGEVDVEPTFYDCRHHWARTSIEAAASAGWVNGVSAGEFQPNGTLTRRVCDDARPHGGRQGYGLHHQRVSGRPGRGVVHVVCGLGHGKRDRGRLRRRDIPPAKQHHPSGNGEDHGKIPELEGTGHHAVVRDLVVSDQRPEHHRRLGARAGLLLL